MGLIARGADLPSLFANAALGLMALVVEAPAAKDGEAASGGLRERVTAEGEDAASLLVNWLNQVLFLYTARGMVFRRFDVTAFSETSITAEAEGERLKPGQAVREVKAATFHRVAVERVEGGWRARVIFDV